jgi:hypothetical protein
MDCRAFAAPKGLRPRRRVKPGNDALMCFGASDTAGVLRPLFFVMAGLVPAIHVFLAAYL